MRYRSRVGHHGESALVFIILCWRVAGIVPLGRRRHVEQQRLDSAGTKSSLVVTEVELRRIPQADPLTEKMWDFPADFDEVAHPGPALVLIHSADEAPSEVQVRAAIDACNRQKLKSRVFEALSETINHCLA